MSTIVPTLAQALRNIERFKEELDGSPELQRRLAFARAWYAHCSLDGTLHYAPSKFCGYKDMTADEYVNDDPRDGRRTEKQLQTWFTQIDPADPLYDELSEGLMTFLADYGKPPSTAFRLNVTNEFYRDHNDANATTDDRTVADLIIAVSKQLSPPERARVKAAL